MPLNTKHDSVFVTDLECIFSGTALTNNHVLEGKLFCNKHIFQITCLNYEICIIIINRIIFSETSTLNNLRRKIAFAH